MKKHYSIRYKACGLVFAIAATNVLAVTGSPLNLGSSKLFPESTLTIARADDVLSEDIILSADDLRISSDGNVIEGLSDTGKAKLMSAIKENAVYQLVFPESLSATEIKDEAFYYIYESLATSSNPDDFEKYKTAQKMKITVKLSDNITKVGDGAFRQNPYITGVIFGDKTEYIGEASFQFCKIKGELILPDTVSYIGSGAFNDNRITEVKLPDNIKKVEHRAFSDNRITRFDFGAYTSVNTEANIGRAVNPDTDELEYIKASGKVIPDYFLTNNPLSEIVLPSGITAIGIEAFRLAPDSEFRPEYPVNNLIIPETVEDIGVAAFMGHPINSLTLTGSSLKRIRESAFEDSHIGGDLTIPDSVNIIENKAFKNNNLKSIMVGGLKAKIKSANSTDNSPFSDNPGWYDDNRKVALYRGNEANEFITDNKLADTTTYVYNPVVLEFNIKDKNGVDLKPATISVARENATVPDVTDVKDTEYDTYKLGDKLTFTLSGSLPDGYEFSASGINSLGNMRTSLP